ncbi:MAG: hypothetical protein LM517_12405 [Nitrosomonas sp.]|nr:hypothetical protein [Nitrosomonas sp.]
MSSTDSSLRPLLQIPTNSSPILDTSNHEQAVRPQHPMPVHNELRLLSLSSLSQLTDQLASDSSLSVYGGVH